MESPSSPLAASPEGDIITKGAFFPDQKACTKAMRHYAASHNMTVKLAAKNRGGSMLRYRCDGGEECRFEVTMLLSQAQARKGYFISRCDLSLNKCTGCSRLPASQVRDDELIRSLVASDPRVSGQLIVDHIKRIRGSQLSLNEAYRARNLILDDLYGSLEEGFQKLESLMDTWKTKNPTSYSECDFNGEGDFVRAFISHPYAALYEFHGQHIAGVDGAFLCHRKYRSVLLVLVGRDGNNNNIILAVAVCSSENEDNCEWFFRCCLKTGVKLNTMPLFSDRGSGIMAALEGLSVTTIRYCTRHIYENIQDKFRGKCPVDMQNILYRVQAATCEEKYDGTLKTLELTHKDIAQYIRGIDPKRWVLYTALRSSRLYGWRSTNFVESQNGAATEPRRMLPFQFLQHYMEKFMQEAYERREVDARRWVDEGHELTKYARAKLEEATTAAAFCTVDPSDSHCEYVYDTRVRPIHRRVVDVEARTCSCTVFDQYGIPCKHFIATLDFFKRSAERFTVVDECYKIRAYSALYGAGADSGIQLALNEELTSNLQHRPPKLCSKPGRKKERRLPSKGDSTTRVGKLKRTSKCSNCGRSGHNRRGCPTK